LGILAYPVEFLICNSSILEEQPKNQAVELSRNRAEIGTLSTRTYTTTSTRSFLLVKTDKIKAFQASMPLARGKSTQNKRPVGCLAYHFLVGSTSSVPYPTADYARFHHPHQHPKHPGPPLLTACEPEPHEISTPSRKYSPANWPASGAAWS
jgi:hypothetical protein